MEMMKNVVFYDKEKLEVEEHPIPRVTPDTILIKIEACGVCTWEQRVYTGVKKLPLPFIGGHEIAGKIVEIGENVSDKYYKIGDKVTVGMTMVCGDCPQCKGGNEQNCLHFNHTVHMPDFPYYGVGGMSSYLVVKPANVFKYSNVSPEEATIAEPLACVLHSIETGDSKLGDTVLVIGAGIMGLLHTILSVKRGASVIVSDMNEERLKKALSLGASHVINPAKENLEERVVEITEGRKAQVVFDTTPISAVVEEAIKCVSNNGKVILYSSFYPDKPVSFSPDWLHKSGASIMGSANSNTVDFVKATRLLSDKIIDVKPFISEIYDVEDAEKAFQSAIKGDKFRVIIKF